MIIIMPGINSFTSEPELYRHLGRRLNGDNFSYLSATQEALAKVGIADADADASIAQVFANVQDAALNDMQGATLAAIEAALTASGIPFDTVAIERVYNLLTQQQTAIQIKNAKALILATQLIDQFEFIGKPTQSTQSLQWPRRLSDLTVQKC